MKITSFRFSALSPLLKKATTKRQLRRIAPIAGGLALLVLIVVFQMVLSGNGGDQSAGSEAYKDQLRGQVTTEDGAPRDGRDPASQKQNSLASSANKPTGSHSQRTNSPASGIVGSQGHHHEHQTNQEQTGLNTNGCYIGYGKPGEQCLPAHAAENGVLTCEGVRTHGGFPDGIEVTGEDDPYNLDTNNNGIACDAGD